MGTIKQGIWGGLSGKAFHHEMISYTRRKDREFSCKPNAIKLVWIAEVQPKIKEFNLSNLPDLACRLFCRVHLDKFFRSFPMLKTACSAVLSSTI